MKNLVLFASGSGSNVENIIKYFEKSNFAFVSCLFSNRKDAFALERAKRLNVNTRIFDKADFYQNNHVLNDLIKCKPDLIVLAGFLWLVPSKIIEAFPGKIINIHPALLPAYGGKGMYGEFVHRAVIANKEKQSGITIHYVNEFYDDGDIIFQATCDISPEEDPLSLAVKIHKLEQKYFPMVIEQILSANNDNNRL